MTRYSREGLRRAELVRQFLRLHVRHTKDRWAGTPFLLEDWQWEKMILPVYGTLNRNGRRRFTKALWGLPRWSGKDEMCAALNLAHLTVEPIYGGEQYAVAASLSQGGVLLDTARKMAMADSFLRGALDLHRARIDCRETGAVFRVLPHNADTAQTFHGSFVVVNELHVHRNAAMLNAMLSGMVGREEPLLIVITTAGEQRKGVWWETLKAWRKEMKEGGSAYVWWHGAPDSADSSDPGVWRAANPASWVSDRMLEDRYHSMPLSDFSRYHLNRAPKHGLGRIFDADRWRACSAPPVIDTEQPCTIGVDAAQRRDHTAVVLDQMDAEGVHNVMCFAFAAEEEGEIMSAIDRDAVAQVIRELYESYNVVRIPCDRAYNVHTMGQLLAEGLPIEQFAQSDPNMTRACQRLFDAVAEGRVRHGGDPVLEEYVLNASTKTGRQGGFRFTKPDEESKIDGAIALAMAVDTAEADADEGRPGASVG